ncbi:MAG: hypothetical protein OEZ06_20035 [Myxococcales bacterium]|nr:hypothetical protein [Myxococcales bacterium]
MRRRLIIGALRSALLTILFAALPRDAHGEQGDVATATRSVFKVRSTCTNEHGTGFAVKIGSKTMLVTALHVVSGCTKLEIEDESGDLLGSKPLLVDRANDLVEISQPNGFNPPALAVVHGPPQNNEVMRVIGYGQTPTAQSKKVQLRETAKATDTVATLVKSSKALNALKKLGFPSLKAKVLNTEGSFYPGDSGAPLIVPGKGVIGVANGGLLEGTIPVTWAMPSAALFDLAKSKDRNHGPEQAGAKASELLLSATESGRPGAKGGGIECHSTRFVHLATRTLETVMSTADRLSFEQINIALALARQAGAASVISSSFDIYFHDKSGATFVVPEGMSLRQQGAQGCEFIDVSGDLALLVYNASTRTPMELQRSSLLFEEQIRGALHAIQNPRFSMWAPLMRQDGMQIRRVAAYLSEFGAPPSGEYAVSHTAKGSHYLGVAFRSNIVGGGLSGRYLAFYPALVSVYASSFRFGP